MSSLVCGDRVLPVGGRTLVMGVVNVTPDSFSDGGRMEVDHAVAHAEALHAAGADVLDIGGESTRPDAVPVPVEEELRRVLPVVHALVARGLRHLSIDTRNAVTAARCLDAGASWINDVSALRHDPHMARQAARADAVVLMHAAPMTQGAAGAHGDATTYRDVVDEVATFLRQRMEAAIGSGVARERIVLDPGIGFGKSVADNLALTRGLPALLALGPVLFGASRKRFLGALTGVVEPAARDTASLAMAVLAAERGAAMVRVHDVARTVEALRVADALSGRTRLDR